MLDDLFNMCLQKFVFPDCWKVSSGVPVLAFTTKNYPLACFLSVFSNIFKKLANNRFVDHLGKCGLFFISSIILGLTDQLLIL